MQKKKDTTPTITTSQQTRKQSNNFKALYQLTKQRRSQINNNSNSNNMINTNTNTNTNNSSVPNFHKQQDQQIKQCRSTKRHQQVYEQIHNKDKNKTIIRQSDLQHCQKSQREKDSLDQFCILNQEQKPYKQINLNLVKQSKIKQKQKSAELNIINKNKTSKKKSSHNRSNSCPFMNLSHIQPKIQHRYQKFPPYFQKLLMENQSKRTLKKTSTLHRKNRRIDGHKYSISHCSQFSQQSNTVIVHSLPIQHLSSMLYESHHEKQHNFKKSGLTQILPEHVFTIHNDIYFQTRLDQQIKMYDLSQQMKKLHKQTDNVKIKQVVLQKLANKFQRQEFVQPGHQDSLLIH